MNPISVFGKWILNPASVFDLAACSGCFAVVTFSENSGGRLSCRKGGKGQQKSLLLHDTQRLALFLSQPVSSFSSPISYHS